MNRRINETLLELMSGIFATGLVIQIVQLVICVTNQQFSGARAPFAIGLWLGVATALGLAVHMYRSIERALDMISSDAEGYMRKTYLIRTAAILVLAGVVTYLKLGYVMAFFLGVLCLKFGAFLQPLIHSIREKFRK